MSDLNAYGTRQRWTFDEHTPRDGEELADLVYHDDFDAWIYPASYDDSALCSRRSESLARSFGGVPFEIFYYTGEGAEGWYAGASRDYTAALQRAVQRAVARYLDTTI